LPILIGWKLMPLLRYHSFEIKQNPACPLLAFMLSQ